jgi:hypothetical protein
MLAGRPATEGGANGQRAGQARSAGEQEEPARWLLTRDSTGPAEFQVIHARRFKFKAGHVGLDWAASNHWDELAQVQWRILAHRFRGASHALEEGREPERDARCYGCGRPV